MNVKMRLLTVLMIVSMTGPAYTAPFNDQTVARLDGKEVVSAIYFKDLRDRIRKDPIEKYIRKLDFNKNFNSQILRIIAENYILWKEGKSRGYHRQTKFKQRFVVALQGFFAEYISRILIQRGKIKKENAYDSTLLNEYLIHEYNVQIDVTGVKDEEVFVKNTSAPSIDLYGKLPEPEFTPYQKFNKKAAEKYNIISYRVPGAKERSFINLRTALENMSEFDFFKFKSTNIVGRNELMKSIISGDLIPLEFRRLSLKDTTVKEYIRRVEQVSLARYYRMVRGIDPATNYALMPDERDLFPVTLTEKEMRDYFNKNLDKFKRPRTCDAMLIRLNRAEVDEGDEFLEMMKEFEEPYQVNQKKLFDLQDKRGLLVQKSKTASAAEKAKMEKEINILTGKIAAANTAAEKMRVDIAGKKSDLFKKKMDELNSRENRVNGEVKKSVDLGVVTFDNVNEGKRYENIAFSVDTELYNGKESILFNSGEEDYMILFVKNNNKVSPPFEDVMVQKRIRYNLEVEKRRVGIRDLINKNMKSVLKKEDVNWKILNKI